MNTGKFSAKSRSASFRFAFDGLASLLKTEHNARIHLVAAVTAVAAGIILKVEPLEWCLLIVVIGLVFLTELMNTSIETIADAVDSDWNEKVRKAKDLAAAAVFISAIIAVITGGIIFLPKIFDLL